MHHDWLGAGTGIVIAEVRLSHVRLHADGQSGHGFEDIAHLPGVIRPGGGQPPRAPGAQHPCPGIGEAVPLGHQVA